MTILPPENDLSSPNSVRSWLASKHPKELAELDKFETELRLGRLSTSSTASAKAFDANPNAAYEVSKNYGGISSRDRRLVTFRTVALLRRLIGTTKWKNAAQLMMLLRGLGRDLHDAGGDREPAIGNIVRRIMCAVRQEVANAEVQDNADAGNANDGKEDMDTNASNDDDINMHPIDEHLAASFQEKVNVGNNRMSMMNESTTTSTTRSPSLVNLLWAANPNPNSNRRKKSNRRKDSFSSVDSDPLDHRTSGEDNYFPPSFYVHRQYFRPAIMEVIQEFMSDLEDLHKNINDQATWHIHTGEVILTYGRSKTVESVSFSWCKLSIQLFYFF